MSGKDANEKLAYAAELVATGTYHEVAAGWDHIKHILTSTKDPVLRGKAQAIADNILRTRL